VLELRSVARIGTTDREPGSRASVGWSWLRCSG